jgi:hypothetical protein
MMLCIGKRSSLHTGEWSAHDNGTTFRAINNLYGPPHFFRLNHSVKGST